MFVRGLRRIPKLGWLTRQRPVNLQPNAVTPAVCSCRGFFSGRGDPFTQMDKFMRDMERKFWREVDSKFGETNYPRYQLATSDRGRSLVSDLSSEDKYKLVFSFPKTDPENIKVSLKDQTLTIEASLDESTQGSRVSQSFKFQYTIPEGVNTDALQSHLSNDGILTIEAPRANAEGPKPIDIKRE